MFEQSWGRQSPGAGPRYESASGDGRNPAPAGRQVFRGKVFPPVMVLKHGGGEAMMAYCPDEVVATVLAGELRPLTDRTITDPELLRAEFAALRRRGFSIGDRENEPEVRCVAAPIFGSDDHVVAALSVSSLSLRMTAKRVSEVGAMHTEASPRISGKLVSRRASARLAELGPGRA